MKLLYIALGGASGALLRYIFVLVIPFSYIPTLVANVLGSLLLGFLSVYVTVRDKKRIQAFANIGFMGSLTTFSTFALEVARLGTEKPFIALAYSIVMLFLGIAFAFIGRAFGQVYVQKESESS